MIPRVFVDHCDVGMGVFAAAHFRPGDLILTLRGARVDRNDPMHGRPEAGNLLQTGRSTYILPISPGVYVNHSCNPNAGISRNRRLIALTEILPSQEVRFDYSTTMDDEIWSLECRCGAAGCRGLVLDFHFLPAHLRDRYLELGVVSGFIARRYRRSTARSASFELPMPTAAARSALA